MTIALDTLLLPVMPANGYDPASLSEATLLAVAYIRAVDWLLTEVRDFLDEVPEYNCSNLSAHLACMRCGLAAYTFGGRRYPSGEG